MQRRPPPVARSTCRRLAMWALVGGLLASPLPAAWAEDSVPCARLGGTDKKQYLELVETSTASYADGDYLAAIETILALKRICDEDPRLDFNLARAYQRANNCNMARYWFENLQTHAEKFSEAYLGNLPALASSALVELSAECKASCRVEFVCVDENVSLKLIPVATGDPLTLECPYSGRINGGNYLLRASIDGEVRAVQPIELVRGLQNQVLVPELPQTPSALASLVVHCPDGVQETTLTRGGLDAETIVPCGRPAVLSPGRWVVGFRYAGYSFEELVDLSARTTTDLYLTRPGTPEDTLSRVDWGWAAAYGGAALIVSGGAMLAAASLMQSERLVATRVDSASGTVLDYRYEPAEHTFALTLVGGIVGGLGVAAAAAGAVIILQSGPEHTDVAIESALGDGVFVGLTARF